MSGEGKEQWCMYLHRVKRHILYMELKRKRNMRHGIQETPVKSPLQPATSLIPKQAFKRV